MSRVALITGGSRGIGLGIAAALAGEDCDLALCGLRPVEQVEVALAELRRSGAKVVYRQADVAERADRESLLRAVRETYGRLDILVNNAGAAPDPRADILQSSEESFDRMIGINLRGPYFLTQAAARWMREQAAERDFSGCIINVSSISAVVPSVDRGDYCLAKAGIGMATRLWAVRLAEYGIPVYEIRPGLIATDMTEPAREKYDRLMQEGLLLEERWGRPEDVGRIAAMMVRGDLPYSTGQTVTADGGLTLQRL